MRGSWKTSKLEEVCQFSNGLWKGEKPPFVNVEVIRNTNFSKDGILDDSNIISLDVEARQLEKRRLQFGDIILEKSGGGPKQAVGRVVLFDKTEGDYSFSNFTSSIRVLQPEELDFRFLHKFLYWIYLSGLTESMQSHSTGIRNLDGNAYKKIEMMIPPLPEQRRIVALLDEAFDGIAAAKANAERNLRNAGALFTTELSSIFDKGRDDWDLLPFGDIVASTLIGIDRNSRGQGVDREYAYIKMNNISRDNQLDVSKITRIDASPDEVSRFQLRNGDFLFNTRNSVELVGKSCVYSSDNEDVTLYNNNIMRIRFKEFVDPKFILLGFSSKQVVERINNIKRGTTNVAAIYYKDLAGLLVPVAASKVQRAVSSRFDELQIAIKHLECIYQNKLAALSALKSSLLHHAFAGEL